MMAPASTSATMMMTKGASGAQGDADLPNQKPFEAGFLVSIELKPSLSFRSVARTSKSDRIGRHGGEKKAPNLQQGKCKERVGEKYCSWRHPPSNP
jgi:hypothetical protein